MSLSEQLRLSIVSVENEPDAVYKRVNNRDSRTQCALLYAWLGETLVAYYFSDEVDMHNKPTNIQTLNRKEFEANLKKFGWEKLN